MKITGFWKRTLSVLVSLVAVLGFLGCAEGTTTTTTKNNTTPQELPEATNVSNFTDYDQLLSYLSDFYDETGTGTYRFKNFFYSGIYATEAMMDGAVVNDAETTTGMGDRTHSEVNSQVEGVLEYDTVLTDGYHIYFTNWQHFFILDADTLEVEFDMTAENGYFTGMFLDGDRLVLLGSEYHYEETKAEDDRYYWYHYSYGVRVWVYDVALVSEEIDPALVKELYFENSWLADARMVDGYVYLVMNNYCINYGFTEDSFVPVYRDSAVGTENLQLPADHIYAMPHDNESFNYLLLASFSAMDGEAARVDAYLGSSYQIYMSRNNLYSVVYRYWYDEETGNYDYSTYIVRFALAEDHTLVYQALAVVEGSPLNQFSMDEYDGHFRIATTGYEYTPTSWTITNTLYVLDATSVDVMTLVGTLPNLGKPNERIYSCRFDGEEAFVVTFVQTDPMYWIDLSDPANPSIIDELYEDGVSDYIHVISDDLKLGIGRMAENVDGWTRFTGVKVELYRAVGTELVSLESYLAEGEYSYTNVSWDHKAFMSYQPAGADFIYVSVPIYEYYENWSQSSQNLYVFKVYFSGDLEMVAKLSHMDPTVSTGYYWYWDSIQRSLVIGSRIYTVSDSKIQMYDMANGFQILAKTELENGYYCWYGWD